MQRATANITDVRRAMLAPCKLPFVQFAGLMMCGP